MEHNTKAQAILKEVGSVDSGQSSSHDKTDNNTLVAIRSTGPQGMNENTDTKKDEYEGVADNIMAQQVEAQTQHKIDDTMTTQGGTNLEKSTVPHAGEEPRETLATVDLSKVVVFAYACDKGDLQNQANVAYHELEANMALTLTSNKFQVLSRQDTDRELEVRSEGVSDDAKSDAATSKLDGEVTKAKKERPTKRNIPPSDRLTRSVAKKGETSTTN